MGNSISFRNDNSEVNGIKMYYEVNGDGKQLVRMYREWFWEFMSNATLEL